MIDGLLPPRKRFDNLPPSQRENMSKAVIGDHTKDTFRPPAAVAAKEEQAEEQVRAAQASQQPPGDKSKRSLMAWLKHLNTKQKWLLTAASVAVASGAVIGAYFLFFAEQPQPSAPVIANQDSEEPAPTTVASNLTGLQVDPSVNERPVIAVMIENSTESRPQSGLHQAGVVFEAIAEGGITRFVALYQDTEPDYVGPVRSARPYYITWLLGFDAAYAHAGGSAEALSLINQWRVKDIPHHNSYYSRISNRAAPHNLYTSIAQLRDYAASKGYGKSNFTPLPRKEKEEPATAPTAKVINFNISSSNFNVQYDYDPSSNTYKRSVGGTTHTDERSGSQISPKSVVALIMPQGKNGIYYTYQTVGSGQAFIFQDGTVSTGTWHKGSNNDNLRFTDANGAELKLNPGQTWFTALGGADRVTYAP